MSVTSTAKRLCDRTAGITLNGTMFWHKVFTFHFPILSSRGGSSPDRVEPVSHIVLRKVKSTLITVPSLAIHKVKHGGQVKV